MQKTKFGILKKKKIKGRNSSLLILFSYYKANETSRNPYFKLIFQEENFKNIISYYS